VRHFEDCTAFAKADLDRVRALVESGSLPGETAEKARVDHTRCATQLEGAKEHLAMLRAGPTVTEVAVAQTLVNEATARLALVQAKLDECVLHAPFAGVITSVLVRPGDLVTPRTPLLEIMDPASLVVRFSVPETHISNMREDAKAVVRLDAYPGKTFQAAISRIYPELARNTRTCLAEAKVLDPAVLMPGQFARVSVELRTVEDAVVVPDKAVLSTAQGDMVVFVVNDGKAIRKKVKVGLEEKEKIQIADGIQAGEMVIFTGNEKLKNGMPVKLGEQAPSGKGRQESAAALNRHEEPSGPTRKTPGRHALGESDVEPFLFQDRYPARLRVYDKAQLRYRSLDELCEFLLDKIEKHPFARYIATFDHYAHTTGLREGVINPEITGAKIVIFCFGKKVADPKILAVRPRAIGICETNTQFIITFLEAPESAPTETIAQWIRGMAETGPSGNGQADPGGSSQ
jgi:biotin carboxyl carrier protein